jgi:ribonuclease D
MFLPTFQGLPLNKNQQISNWSRRPLNIAQLLYSANDAHCLILLSEHLRIFLRQPGNNDVIKMKKRKNDAPNDDRNLTVQAQCLEANTITDLFDMFVRNIKK